MAQQVRVVQLQQLGVVDAFHRDVQRRGFFDIRCIVEIFAGVLEVFLERSFAARNFDDAFLFGDECLHVFPVCNVLIVVGHVGQCDVDLFQRLRAVFFVEEIFRQFVRFQRVALAARGEFLFCGFTGDGQNLLGQVLRFAAVGLQLLGFGYGLKRRFGIVLDEQIACLVHLQFELLVHDFGGLNGLVILLQFKRVRLVRNQFQGRGNERELLIDLE